MSVRIYLFYLILFFLTGCELITTGPSEIECEIDPNYPTTLYPLSIEELQLLQAEFDVLNNSTICSKLNEYGFPFDGDFSKIHPNPQIKINATEAIQVAVNCLLKNKKFTNISDSLAILTSIIYINSWDDSTKWSLSFGPQCYKGLEIPYSRVNVSLYADGVASIQGFWYSDIFIPKVNRFSQKEAEEIILGEKILWAGYGGEPHEFIVTKQSIIEPLNKAIFPAETDTSIELRVVWKIPIDFGSFIGWHIYLDTSTGEIVAIIQEFCT